MRGRDLFRLLRIFRILRAHGLHEVAHALRPKLPTRKPRVHVPYEPSPDLGRRLREALEHLGPIFVKFGQALSTRPDLLPPDIARELAKLQDDVPPFPSAEARGVVEHAYGKPLHEVFRDFEADPLASASIAQVHSATLHDGTAVVVKILRPNVEVQIDRDLNVLRSLAELAHRFWPESRRLRPRDIVSEYSKTINDELDFMREAANASQLKRNWEHSPVIKIPEVYWDYCHPNVMVMEKVYGVPISDVEQLNAHKVNMKLLAERGVEIFFTQVFKHNFFHADMHPGNIFVDVTDPDDPNYVSVDFGIVGTLDPADQHYLAANLLAFFHRDYRKVAQLHVDSQWVPPGTRVDEFESAIRTVCEPIFNKPLKDISFGQFLVRLFATARRFQMEVQPQLVLLQKTLLNIEGLGRQLYPELDLWDTAKPFLEDWMKEKMSGKELWSRLQDQLPEISGNIHEAPLLLMRALHQVADGTLHFGTDPKLEQERRIQQFAIERKRQRAIIGGGLLVTTAVLAGLQFEPAWVTLVSGITALILLFRARM